MANTKVPIDRAREAKRHVREHFPARALLNGIGLTRVGTDYALKVNLAEPLPPGTKAPSEIDGVPVVVEIVGALKKRR